MEPRVPDTSLNSLTTPRDVVAHPVALTGAQTTRLIVALVAAALSLGFGTGAFSGITIGIGRVFHASAGQLNWVISVPLLSTVVCAPIVGRLGDVFGHRRMLVISVAGTALGGVLAAVAPSFGILLLGRLLQGLIGGVFGLGPAIVRDRLSIRRGHTVIAALAGATSLGLVAGLLCAARFGGQHDGTRIVLWSSAAVFAAAAALCMITPDSVSRAAVRVDWLGAAVLAVGLACVFLGLRQAPISGWSDAATVAYLAAGAAALTGWIPLEARTRQPFIDVRRVVSRGQLSPCAISFIFGVGAFGAQTAAITFMGSPGKLLGYGLSMPITDIASWLIPCAIVGAIAAILASRLAAAIGNRAAFLSGSVLLTIGFALMIVWHQATAEFVFALIVQYAGIGVSLAMVPVVLSELAGPGERGVVTSLGESLRGLGGGLSTAVFATLEGSLVIAHTTVPTEDAYLWVWGICGLVSAASIPLALIVPRAGAAVGGKLAAQSVSLSRWAALASRGHPRPPTNGRKSSAKRAVYYTATRQDSNERQLARLTDRIREQLGDEVEDLIAAPFRDWESALRFLVRLAESSCCEGLPVGRPPSVLVNSGRRCRFQAVRTFVTSLHQPVGIAILTCTAEPSSASSSGEEGAFGSFRTF